MAPSAASPVRLELESRSALGTALGGTRSLVSLKGKKIVVTGGARGIGLTIARGVAELGGDVAILDTLEQPEDESFEDWASDFGVKARYFRTDVTIESTLHKTFADVVAEFGCIDGCVAAAGVLVMAPFLEHTWDDVVRIQMVNVVGTFFSAQFAAQKMRSQGTGGSIVMIASVAAHVSSPHMEHTAYAASKGAVKALGQALSVELGPYNIRVNTVSPGYIRTAMTDKVALHTPSAIQRFSTEPPLGRIGTSVDVMGAIAYLLSDAASYVSGTDILVTGGLHAGRFPEDRNLVSNGACAKPT